MIFINKLYENKLKKDLITISQYDYLIDYIKSFSEFEKIPKLHLNTLNISNKKIISMTKDFYQKYTPKYIYNAFVTSYNNTKLKMLPPSNTKYCGHFDFDNITKKGEITLLRYYNLDDIITLAHEYAHGIQITLSPKYIYNSIYIFDEVFSTFFEILCSNYFELNNFSTESIKCQINNLSNKIIIAKLSINEINFLNNTKNIQTKEELKKAIFFTKYSPLSNIPYLIAYIIAINLITMYNKDPEYAFYILKEISNYEENKTSLEKFIELENLGLFEITPIKENQNKLIRKKEI